MKKLLLFLVFAAVVFSPTIASAQTATSSPQTIRDRIKTLRGERQQLITETREELAAKKEAFRAQIKTIKDLRKQLLTERIANKTASANTKLTDRMDRALDHLTEILAKVKEKAAAFKAQGKDTTALNQAISAAETAIAAAQTAVDAQKLKEYTANITDESILRNTMGQMVSGFRLDIQAVHKLVVDAKQAVQKAIMEAAKLRGESNTATQSANI